MHAVILVQVPALQQAKLAKARAEEAEAARRAKAQEITRRKEAAKVAKVRLAGLRPLLPPLFCCLFSKMDRSRLIDFPLFGRQQNGLGFIFQSSPPLFLVTLCCCVDTGAGGGGCQGACG